MADIRINSLPTTASASSSDDFLALDGATNGTRKLNAYSPTFGGNLTTNGVLTVVGNVANIQSSSGVESYLRLNQVGTTAWDIRNIATSGALYISNSGSDWITIAKTTGATVFNGAVTAASTLAVSGNLTVSGTGTSTFAGAVGVQTAAATYGGGVGQFYIRDGTTPAKRLFMGYDTVLDGGYIVTEQTGVANKTLFVQPGGGATTIGGNLTVSGTGTSSVGGKWLVGTGGVDSGALLQVGTNTTTSAGGMIFGTDTRLYRTAGQTLTFQAATQPILLLTRGSAAVGYWDANSATNTRFGANIASGTLELLSGAGTVALTLDSSQNATFAGLIGIAGNTLRGVGKVYNSATGDAYGMEQVSGSQNTGNQSRAAVRFFSPSGQGSEFDFGYYSDASTFNTHTRINTTGITTTGSVIVSNSQTPASASATGTTGTIAWDASYIYVCTATNTWKRVAIATWP